MHSRTRKSCEEQSNHVRGVAVCEINLVAAQLLLRCAPLVAARELALAGLDLGLGAPPQSDAAVAVLRQVGEAVLFKDW